jgi:L-fuconolactonase
MTDAFLRDLALTAKLDNSIDFLIGFCSLKDIHIIAERLPHLRIILDHFGNVRLDDKPLAQEWVADFRAAAKHPNVYCKVSTLYGRFVQQPAPRSLDAYRETLDLSYESFGENRLGFGSDWPVSESTADYANLSTLTKSYFSSKDASVAAKVFHRNTVKFYALPEKE